MKTYLFSYRYEGAEYAFEMPAESLDDAKRRVARIQYATLDGELVAKVPVNSTISVLLSPLLSFFFGLFRGGR